MKSTFETIVSFDNVDLVFEEIEKSYDDIIYITDNNVYQNYKKYFIGKKYINLKPGETSKNLDVIHVIYSFLIYYNCTKNTLIVGVGGGVITDMTGYAASTFMRGIKFGFVTTSLLGMVDASIGGKNGVNFDGLKNMIGTINPPTFIYWSTDFLDTLPYKEIHNGFGEILKYAIGFDQDLFEFLYSKNTELFFSKDDIKKIIIRCQKIKAGIVDKDLYENLNERKKLNLGHTIGHAIEKSSNNSISHGVAVGNGILFISKYCKDKNILSKKDFDLIKEILKNYEFDYTDNRVFDCQKYISYDKKSLNQEEIDLILIDKIGNCIVNKEKKEELIKYINLY